MPVLDTVLASTLERSRRKLILAAAKSNALMAWAFASERVEVEPGGYNITNPLTVGRNPNVTTGSYYDAIPVAQTNEFVKLEYRWTRVYGTVIISRQEEDENRGETAIFKLMKAKMDVLEESIKEKFSTYLYGSGAGNDPNGLLNLIPDDPTTGSLAGLSRVTETQWRTSSYDFNGTLDETNIEEALDDVFLDLTMKGDKPTVVIMGRNLYRFLRAAVRDKMVLSITDLSAGKRMVDLGFTGMTHQNVTIMYDEDCPVNKAYVINDKYLRLHILKGVNMRDEQLVAPWTMDARGARVTWQGQWALWKAYRAHAVIINE